MKRNFLFILVVGVSFLFTACEGPVGPPGPPGFDGIDGNANVFSIKYDIVDADWLASGNPGEDGYFLFLDLVVPEITPDIVESGLVLAYYRQDDNSAWLALPFTEIITEAGNEFTEVFDFIYDRELISLRSIATDRNATAYVGTVRVIVADGIPIARKGQGVSNTSDDIDWRNYEEVMAYFGLEE